MPKNKCNDCDLLSISVKLRQGDLMLCEACNAVRFPPYATKNNNASDNTETHPKSDISSCHVSESTKDNPAMFQNELLAYILYYYSCSSIDCIKKAVISFYTPEEIYEAKEQLWATNEGKINCSKHRRISTSTRAAHEADLNDIISVVSDLDRQGDIYLGKYYAVNIGRIPKCAPEEFNTFAMIDRMRAVEIQMAEIKELAMNNCSKISVNTTKITDTENKLTNNDADIKRIDGQIQNIKVSVDNLKPSYSFMLSGPPRETKTVTNTVVPESDPTSMKLSVGKSNDTISASNNVGTATRQLTSESRVKENITQQSIKAHSQYQFHKAKPLHRDRFTSVSSIASSAVNNKKDDNSEGNFQYPPYFRRKLRRQHIVTGTGPTSRLRGAPLPSRDVFIYRLNRDTSIQDIEAFLNEKDIEVRELDCLSHADAKYKSFKLSISVNDLNTVFSEDFWPMGVKIRKFRQPTNNVFS